MDEQLRGNAIFAGIPPEELARLDLPITVRRFGRDEIVFDEGDPGESVFLIAKGMVRISKSGRGGQQETLAMLSEGNYFGEMALIDDEPRSARATAVEPATLGCIDRDCLHRLLGHSPEAALHFVRTITRQLRSSSALFIRELRNSERLSLVGTMMSSIVHDFKNPIAVISLVIDYLSNEKDQTKQQLAAVMRGATDQMLAMIQELLDFAKGATKVDLQPTTVKALLEVLDAQMLDLVAREGIEVCRAVDYDGPVTIDTSRIVRLLCNVIKNAKEAMPTGGKLTVRVTRSDEELAIDLTDTGCGIPKDVLARIFEPFVTHGKKGGTGLGMAIAKSVVEAHKGRIFIESEEGKGTTCRIRLPLESPAR